MNLPYRYYQKQADDAIYQELSKPDKDKCLVKMFCGSGKSLLMRKCKILHKQNLIVYVFPTLQLISQFCNDYLYDVSSHSILKISSENDDSTTEVHLIQKFLLKKSKKIICITYQSFKTLLDSL